DAARDSVSVPERRRARGGSRPRRRPDFKSLELPPLEQFQDLLAGSGTREFSTTGGFGRLLNILLRNKQIGKYIVPIIPDEARTFRSEEHTSELQSLTNLVCRLLLEKKNNKSHQRHTHK